MSSSENMMLLQQLPAELQLLIASHLSPRGQAVMCAVDRFFQDIYTKPLYSEGCDLALLWSAKSGVERTFQLAMKYGANIDCVQYSGPTPLHTAAVYGNTLIAELILARGAVVSPLDEIVCTPLHVAIINGHIEIVQLLLRHGADANKPSGHIHEEPCLIVAACFGRPNIIKALLDHGADANITTENQESAISIACQEGYLEAVKLLLKHGVDHSMADIFHDSPLYKATVMGHADVVEVLLEVTPDAGLDGRNEEGWTPLHAAVLEGHLEIMKTLVERGANVRAVDNYMNTPLHHAVIGDQATICKYLIDNGADVNQGDKYDYSALHKAVSMHHVEVTRLLLAHGADVKGTTRPDDCTCLHLACTMAPLVEGCKCLELFKLLVRHGADVTSTTIAGKRPIDFAASIGHDDVVSFLQELGRVPPRRKGASASLLSA